MTNWKKSIRSLHTTETGAVTIKLYRDGKAYVSYGGSTIEDLIPQIVDLIQSILDQKAKEIAELDIKSEQRYLSESGFWSKRNLISRDDALTILKGEE